MTAISNQIARAVEKFRKDLLPKIPAVCNGETDVAELNKRLAELERLHAESLQPPVFSVRFLGDTQNGKSTLVNVLLGRKVLPEGHVGACSATIVRCRYKEQPKITITFRYTSEEQFLTDLAEKIADADVALEEEQSTADQREVVCNLLGRFIRLLQIDAEKIEDPKELVTTCQELALEFEERALLGTEEVVEVNAKSEERIKDNLSARGRRAFIVDECLIEGVFDEWHPSMELVDMPGTNAFNPWDDQVNARLKQKVGGLAIVTKETQLHQTLMDWFKESSILPEIAGSSERNQVRVFVIKTFVDQLNLDGDGEEGQSQWELTRNYCSEIQSHLRKQMHDLVGQRFVAENEVQVLKDFVERMPCHFVSPKVYRNLADDGLRNKVLNDPMKHLDLAAAFQRFDTKPENTGIPELKLSLHSQTEQFIKNHYLKKLTLDFGREVGLVRRFFRSQRVGVERRLADQGAFVLEVDGEVQRGLKRVFKQFKERSETKIIELKDRFDEEVGDLLETVARNFSARMRRKLEDWLHLHWASLRYAGRKNGQHITSRGYEIDFNGDLADLCVEALNSSWIKYRERLRKLLYDDLMLHFIPEMEKVIAQAKGQDEARQELIESTYEEVADSARNDLELQLERYDAEGEEFDALRPKLMMGIRKFLGPTYVGIASEAGRGSAARMRNHLNEGVLSSSLEIQSMVKKVVRKNWNGLTASLETRVMEFFEDLAAQFKAQGAKLREIAEHPSEGDEQRVAKLKEIEELVDSWEAADAEKVEVAV
jgi:hypothetical protein